MSHAVRARCIEGAYFAAQMFNVLLRTLQFQGDVPCVIHGCALEWMVSCRERAASLLLPSNGAHNLLGNSKQSAAVGRLDSCAG